MNRPFRQHQPIDAWINQASRFVETVFGHVQGQRSNPADTLSEGIWSNNQRTESGRLMRINHAGEVAAQALYQGQALVARQGETQAHLMQAADEENDHLQWCRERLDELETHVSYLGPVWYLGSFAIGAIAGLLGDRWSLGFVAETEQQVTTHLENHLQLLPNEDHKSRAIVAAMRDDEIRHGHFAKSSGGLPLPQGVQLIMKCLSKIMTSVAYFI